MAIQQVKQGTEINRFRIGLTRVNMLAHDLIVIFFINSDALSVTQNGL